jgi:hypothetical protein
VTCGDRAAARQPPPRTQRSPEANAPALAGAPGFDETYRWLVDGLPARLRRPAERLPWKLGLTEAPDGRWGDFVRLHPNRELPLYAAQAPDGDLGLDADDLGPFLRAHHLGAFAWLVRDRLEDGQVETGDRLLELAEAFEQRWREAIIDGTGDAVLARTLFRRATTRWQRGTRAEQRVLAAGSMRAPIYAAIVREKLGWIGAPSQALLHVSGDPRRLRPFLQAHDLYLVGLQAIDDVIDAEEDRALRGADVPSALGCSPGALVRAAPKLVSRAAAAAAGGGFTWFARWLDAFAGTLSSWRLAGDALGDELDAIGIAGEIEEAILQGAHIPAAEVSAARTTARA